MINKFDSRALSHLSYLSAVSCLGKQMCFLSKRFYLNIIITMSHYRDSEGILQQFLLKFCPSVIL